MVARTSVDFYMYTTPRFLEFAKQFIGLNFDTKKAESEFEKIEKLDKQATELSELPASDYYAGYRANYGWNEESWPAWNPNFISTQPINFKYGIGDHNPNAGTYPTFVPLSAPEDYESKNKYLRFCR